MKDFVAQIYNKIIMIKMNFFDKNSSNAPYYPIFIGFYRFMTLKKP